MTTRIGREAFGQMPDGTVVERITLHGAEGFAAAIIPYGAVLQALHVPDRAGRSDDIVLGHDTFDEYLAQRKFLGATIGRYANRIAGARFVLDGKPFQLDANNGPNMLHGGNDGFDRKLWRIVDISEKPSRRWCFHIAAQTARAVFQQSSMRASPIASPGRPSLR